MPHVSDHHGLASSVDKTVILIGKPADFPRQHLMGKHMDYPFTAYIELSDATQVGVYLKSRIPDKFMVEITGRVEAIHALVQEGTKAIDTEYQIVADSWRYCP